MDKFVDGIFLGIMIVIALSMWAQKGHNVGADHQVCMTIENHIVNGTTVKKNRCVQGNELMDWMRTLDADK
jgi:hypothetical protein